MRLQFNRRLAGLALADLLVVAALIPLVCVSTYGCLRQTRGGDNRVKCAANLKSIGQTMLLYSNENRGQYPRGPYAPGPVVIPTWGTGATGTPAANDVSAAIFLLLSTQDITGDIFICPSSSSEKWGYGGGTNTAANWANWEGAAAVLSYISYSIQNPYPDDAAAVGYNWGPAGFNADFALAADINPGDSPATGLLTVKPDSPQSAKRAANSPNHGQHGQNVLYGDGHVEFKIDVFSGLNGDNMFVRSKGADSKQSSDVRNSPLNPLDSVLLPSLQ